MIFTFDTSTLKSYVLLIAERDLENYGVILPLDN